MHRKGRPGTWLSLLASQRTYHFGLKQTAQSLPQRM
jgi:hypothetical protein